MHRLRTMPVVVLSLAAASLAAEPLLVSTSQPLPRPPSVRGEEAYLRRAGVGTEPAALVALLRNFSRTDTDGERLEQLVRQLGDEDFDQRERAARALVALGRPALKRLATARSDADAEVSRRATLITEEIVKSLDGDTACAAVRELLHQRADGAAAALLSFLPFADADAEEDIYFGLERVALHDGKLDPALRTALVDEHPARRALAALLLGRLGDDDDRKAVRARLADKQPNVRLRAAQGLLAAHDDAAIPALVALLDGTPIEIAWQAEELLRWVAGPSPPSPRVGMGDEPVRRACRASWQGWLRENGRIDWQRVARDHRRPGLVLVSLHNQVLLVGCDGEPAWKLDGFSIVFDAHLLPNGRLLISECTDAAKVHERDLAGKVFWDYKSRRGEDVVACQRLANGNTFLAYYDGLLEVTPEGQQRLLFQERDESIFDCVPRRFATLLCLTEDFLREIDPTSGTVPRHLHLEGRDRSAYHNQLCALPDGGALLSRFDLNKLLHLSADGTVLWETPLPRPTAIAALRNGNVLAASSPRTHRLVEMTRTGRVVAEMRLASRAKRIRPCFNLLRVGLDTPRPRDFNMDSVAYRTEGLRSPDLDARGRSADYLAEFGPQAASAILALVETLRTENIELQGKAANALARIGAASVPSMIEVMKKGPPRAREAVADALGTMSWPARAAVPELIALLADDKLDLDIRRAATRVLGQLGQLSASAAPALLAALKADDYALRYLAATSLGQIRADNAAVVPALIEALNDPVQMVGFHAVQALGAYGPAAKPATPHLLAYLRQLKPESLEARRVTIECLAAIGANAKAALPTLLALLKDKAEKADIRSAAAQAIVRMGPDAKDAMAQFLDVFKDEATPAQLTQVMSYALLGAPEGQGLPVLMKAAREGTRSSRLAAIQLLGTSGQNVKVNQPQTAKEISNLLQEIADKEMDMDIRTQAERAVKRFEGRGGR